ncbi:uncharacterized protein LOC135377351 [Ornithodoros turicata]|uniref:uncharacterized protein LOC135377351 n=1 Tax=Ornithodoros turicata TaxID=34597 RepID=UPI003139495F
MSRVYFVLCVTVTSIIIWLPNTMTSVRILGRHMVLRGESIWLNCTAESINQVWWYKDNILFYTFERGAEPSTHVFSVPGVYVDQTKSREGSVLLLYTDRQTEGTFLCDIAAAPGHLPQRAHLHLQVVVANPRGPVIEGMQAQYHMGQEIRASCSSGPSKPLPRLYWLINGKQPDADVSQGVALTRNSQELETGTINITLKADKANFINGVMNLTCVMHIRGLPEMERKSSVRMITLGYASDFLAGNLRAGSARLSVPTVVVHGQGFWLNCTAEGAHTFVWHKDNQPFYRDTPGAQRPTLHQSPQGVHVNHTISHGGHVYMDTSDLDTEGIYMCKVILGEVRTRQLEKKVQVYVLPEGPPTLENVNPIYKMGDIVKAKCRSGPSKPAAILTWYVDGVKVENENVSLDQTPADESRTFESFSTLTMLLEPSIMTNGSQLLISCTAQIGTIYAETSEQRLTVLQPQEWALYYAGNSSKSVLPNYSLCVGILLTLYSVLSKSDGSFHRH